MARQPGFVEVGHPAAGHPACAITGGMEAQASVVPCQRCLGISTTGEEVDEGLAGVGREVARAFGALATCRAEGMRMCARGAFAGLSRPVRTMSLELDGVGQGGCGRTGHHDNALVMRAQAGVRGPASPTRTYAPP
jgi:hypothetical protein